MKKLVLVLTIACLACRGEAPKSVPAKKPAPPPPPALTVAQAKEIIANAPELGEYQFTNAAVTLPMKKSLMNGPAQQMAKSLRAAGWIGFSGDDVVLSPKAQSDRRFLVRPNGTVDIVPIAKKEFGEVTTVRSPEADFTWRWIRNDIGKAIGKPDDAEQHANATLVYDGSQWSVSSIR